MKIQTEKRNAEVTAFRELGHTNGRISCQLLSSNCPIVLNDISVATDANAKKQLEEMKIT